MKFIKRSLFRMVAILSLLLNGSMLMAYPYVTYTHEGQTLYYDIDPSYESATVISEESSIRGELIIPSTIEHDGRKIKVSEIASGAFSGCTDLTSISIPESITAIGASAFSQCTGLTSALIPESVTSIGDSAFSQCTGLTSVTIPESVTSIEFSAFSGCTGLTSITIPESVTSIGNRLFYECTGLTSVTIPESVESIGYRAFYGCRNLTSVVLGKNVRFIDQGAFAECYCLESIEITALTPPAVESDAFDGATYTRATLSVPVEAVKAYKEHPVWGRFRFKTIVTSVENIHESDSNSPVCVYTLSGALVVRSATDDVISTFTPGVYILRQGNKTRKIIKQ